MSKQKEMTAVDWLIDNIKIALKLNGVELDPRYEFKTVIPVFIKAKEIEKRQIKDAYDTNRDIDTIQTAEQYYSEKYGAE